MRATLGPSDERDLRPGRGVRCRPGRERSRAAAGPRGASGARSSRPAPSTMAAPPPCASAIARTIARPSPAPPAGGRVARTREALERPPVESRPEAGAVVGRRRSPRRPARPAPEVESPSPWRIALSTRFASAWRTRAGSIDDAGRRRRLDADRPALLGRAVGEPVPRVPRAARGRRRVSGRTGRRPSAARAISEQVLGELARAGPPPRPPRRATRALAPARPSVEATPSSSVLRTAIGVRSSWLASATKRALALERRPQPGEHLVERLPQSPDLVVCRRQAAGAPARPLREIAPARLRIASTGRRPAVASA